MKSTDEIKARAVKLRDLLDGQAIQLKHSESLEVISKIEGYPDWNTHTADISNQQRLAEQYLDEVLEGHLEKNYAKFSKNFDERLLDEVTEKNFLRTSAVANEDYGPYVSRVYLGSVDGVFDEPLERYPEAIRHVWRGIFEKQEAFLNVGIYVKNGRQYIGDLTFD